MGVFLGDNPVRPEKGLPKCRLINRSCAYRHPADTREFHNLIYFLNNHFNWKMSTACHRLSPSRRLSWSSGPAWTGPMRVASCGLTRLAPGNRSTFLKAFYCCVFRYEIATSEPFGPSNIFMGNLWINSSSKSNELNWIKFYFIFISAQIDICTLHIAPHVNQNYISFHLCI